MDDPELIEANGEGAELFDVPVAFYLTFRESIERWHALKSRTDTVIHELLLSLGDPIADLAQQHQLESRFVELGGRYCGFFIAEAEAPTDREGVAPISFGLGWQRDDVVPEREGSEPYVGVRVSRDSPESRSRFLEYGHPSTRELRAAGGYDKHTLWPVFRYVHARPAWWSDLDAYRFALTSELGKVMTQFKAGFEATSHS